MKTAERVRAEDAAFFYLEGPSTPYHIASLMICRGRAPDHNELLDALAPRLAFSPRLMQVVDPVPLARPRWIDDPHFDLGYHLRRTTVEPPGGERELLELAAHLHAQHLDRARPLWELWVIDGLAEDRFAVMVKLHHSMFDGVSGVALTDMLLDPTPEPRSYEPEPWIARPAPSVPRLEADSLVDSVLAPERIIRALLRLARHPRRLYERALDLVGGIASLAGAALDPAPSSPVNLPIGPNRAIAVARASLADIREIKTDLGGTVNDVVLTAAAGGLRRLLQERGVELRVLTLRALVPVSLHRAGDDGAGNHVAGLLAPLPVSESDAVRRLAIVRRATRDAKRSRQSAGSGLLLELGAALPPPIARIVAGAQSVQRFFNVSVTNVPGSPRPLYFRGRRLEEVIPLPPLSANAALIVAAMSYAGEMTFGIVADADNVPDVALVAEGIEKTIAELLREKKPRP